MFFSFAQFQRAEAELFVHEIMHVHSSDATDTTTLTLLAPAAQQRAMRNQPLASETPKRFLLA
jgi:hypothetical protein